MANSFPLHASALFPARRAAPKLHRQYMGHMRKLNLTQKAQVRAVPAPKGIRPAIEIAKRLRAA